MTPEERWLKQELAKGNDHVTDQILNEDGQRARREIEMLLKKGAKTKKFHVRNKKRNKRRNR